MGNDMSKNNEEVPGEKVVMVAENKTRQQAIRITNRPLKEMYSEYSDTRRKYEGRYRPPPQPAGKKPCCVIM